MIVVTFSVEEGRIIPPKILSQSVPSPQLRKFTLGPERGRDFESVKQELRTFTYRLFHDHFLETIKSAYLVHPSSHLQGVQVPPADSLANCQTSS